MAIAKNHEILGYVNPPVTSTEEVAEDVPVQGERAKWGVGDITPNPDDFKDIYRSDEIESDKKLCNWVIRENHISAERDGTAIERVFARHISDGRIDWFAEKESYGIATIALVHTSEIDDVFNHTDFVAVINNSSTGGKPIPFGIDLTCNEDRENTRIRQKMSWEHGYCALLLDEDKEKMRAASRTGTASNPEYYSERISEFGYIDEYGRRRRHPFRLGLEIPGFTSVKYYDDKNSGSQIPKGRICIMPRLVVGIPSYLRDELAKGEPTEEVKREKGKEEYDKQLKSYQKANELAKWLTLLECSDQIKDILEMAKLLQAELKEPTGAINKNFLRLFSVQVTEGELETAIEQAECLKKYFGKAINDSFMAALRRFDGIEDEKQRREAEDDFYAAHDEAYKHRFRTHFAEASRETYLEGVKKGFGWADEYDEEGEN